jgi:hypothetical protein
MMLKGESRISRSKTCPSVNFSQNPTRIKIGRNKGLVVERPATNHLIYYHNKIETSVTNIPSFLFIFRLVQKISKIEC